MSREKEGLTRQALLTLLLLALLPLWYSLGGYSSAKPTSPGDSPYYMECLECALEYPCGPDGVAGMRCPRCARADATIVLRTRGAPVWELLVKLLVGIISFLAVLVLVFADHKPKKEPAPSAWDQTPEQAPTNDAASGNIKEQINDEIKNWARDLAENRRKRIEQKPK